VASYGPPKHNYAPPANKCPDSAESGQVTVVTPTMTTQASPPIPVRTPFTDGAS